LFLNYGNLSFGPKVYLANDLRHSIKEKRTIYFSYPSNVQKGKFDIFYVRGLAKNLSSVSKMIDQGYKVSFKANTCLIKPSNIIVKGVRCRSLYKLLRS